MKWVAIALACAVGLAVLVVGSIFAWSESGEVVVLESRDAQGATHETRLWVVDYGDREWLRTGNPQSGWLARVRSDPHVFVTRGETRRAYRAIPVDSAETRDRVNELMLEKYGFAERYLRALVLDPARVTPVRLDPDEGPDAEGL